MTSRGVRTDARGTIKSAREIQSIFSEARRVANPLVIALVRSTPHGRGPGGRVAFVAGKKLGGAVVRNRAKRVLREAARRARGPWPGFDVVLIARPGTGVAGPAALDAALRDVLARAGAVL